MVKKLIQNNGYLIIGPLHMLRVIWIKSSPTMNLQIIFSPIIMDLRKKLETKLWITSFHLIKWAYSIQWAAVLGVSAKVHKGNFTWGGKSQMVHSKHGVTPGKITLAWPLKPSVPPSTIGLIVSSSGLSSESNSRFIREKKRNWKLA